MSEVKRYKATCLIGEAGDVVKHSLPVHVVYASNYDAAQSELAALREELETLQSKHERTELALSGSMKALTRVDNMWKKRWLEKTGEPAIALVVDDEFKAMFEEIKSYRQRLADAERRNASIIGKVDKCKVCGSNDLYWFAQNTVPNGIQQNRLNTNDVKCLFVLGCNECSETLKLVNADTIAERMTAALNPNPEAARHDE